MISKIVNLLLLSALVCSAISALTMTSNNMHENKVTIEPCGAEPIDGGHPTLILIQGDPVVGGGTP